MAQPINPVLYNIGLQQGRGTGAFRGVRATPKLSDVAAQRNILGEQFAQKMQGVPEQLTAGKNQYDALVKQLQDSVGSARSSYEAFAPTVTAAKSAYESQSKALRDEFQASLDISQANTPGWATYPGGSSSNWRVISDYNKYKNTPNVDTNSTYYKMAMANYDTLMAEVNRRGSTFKTAYDTAVAPAIASQNAYKTAVESANTQSKSAFDSYYGVTSKAKLDYEQGISGLESLGHLAYAAPSPEDASPSPTAAQTLGATDLYSNELEAQVLGRKQTLQSTPEEDVMSGVMQSSLYRS